MKSKDRNEILFQKRPTLSTAIRVPQNRRSSSLSRELPSISKKVILASGWNPGETPFLAGTISKFLPKLRESPSLARRMAIWSLFLEFRPTADRAPARGVLGVTEVRTGYLKMNFDDKSCKGTKRIRQPIYLAD